MMKFTYLLLAVSLISQPGFSQTDDLRRITSPYVEGTTLFITGPIDSHIYDHLAYMSESINSIQKVSLKSYGGDHYWALEIAKKIQLLNITTEISEDSFCASACLYLFGAGTERLMSQSSWIGIHGARLSGGYRVEFHTNCSIENEDDLELLTDQCEDFLERMEIFAMESTVEGFQIIEASGVSPSLRNHYFSLEDQSNWYQHYNVLRTRDWEVTPEVALEHALATEVF